MITHCTKCDINWASLWQDEMTDTEETVEFCPQCGSDQFLQPGIDIVSFIKCPFSGKITNVETGEELGIVALSGPFKRKIKVWDETVEEFATRREQAEDAGITAGSFTGIEMPQRKYHFEEVIIQ